MKCVGGLFGLVKGEGIQDHIRSFHRRPLEHLIVRVIARVSASVRARCEFGGWRNGEAHPGGEGEGRREGVCVESKGEDVGEQVCASRVSVVRSQGKASSTTFAAFTNDRWSTW